MVLTRAMMEEQLKILMEGIDALRNGQEEMKSEMKNEMKSGQEEIKKEMKSSQERIEKGQEELRNVLEEKINSMEEIIKGKVEEKIGEIREEIDQKIGEVEGRIQEVAGNFSLVSQKVEELEKKLLTFEDKKPENRNVPVTASQVPMTASPVPVKLSTFDGKSNWQVYKTQFTIISEANGWSDEVKACQLAVSLRGEAADILQTLPDTERLNLDSLVNALDLRFGQKYYKEYTRLQMKTRFQKTGESLQEYASEIERLTNISFPDYPANVRDMLSLQHFVDGLRDTEIQKAVRMADVEDLKSALLFALKLEAATQASRRDRHSIRGARETGDSQSESSLLNEIKKLIQSVKTADQNQRKQIIKCWGCGGTGHLRRNCPEGKKEEKTVTPTQQGN